MKRLVVIGYPIKHSLSPPMQNAALKALGLENEFVYEKLEVKPGKVAEFAETIRSGEIIGANVTIPHKVEMFNTVDEKSREAELIGAVNTVSIVSNLLVGHCTDGIGCLNSLKEEHVKYEGKRILIIGAGGAARAIAFTLAINDVLKITILNKNVSKAKSLAKEVSEKTGANTFSGGLDKLRDALNEANIVIHCTPVGMKHNSEGKSLISADMLLPETVVMDIVYNPIKTKLLEEAQKAGCKTIDGTGMLVHQGAVGFEIWTGKEAPIEVMREALIKVMEDAL